MKAGESQLNEEPQSPKKKFKEISQFKVLFNSA